MTKRQKAKCKVVRSNGAMGDVGFEIRESSGHECAEPVTKRIHTRPEFCKNESRSGEPNFLNEKDKCVRWSASL